MTADNLSNTSNPSASEPPAPPATDWDVPIPPRFWWLKRITIGSLAIVVLLVGFRLWWGYEADRRLRNLIAELKAKGEPVTVEDFDRLQDAVPPEQNAALLYEKAIKSLVPTSSSGVSLDDAFSDPEKFPYDGPAARELIEKNADARALIRQAEQLPQVAWSHRLADFTKSSTVFWAVYREQRMLIKFLSLSASHHQAIGNEERAVEDLESLTRLGDAIGGSGLLLDQLVSWTALNIANDFVSKSASKLELRDAQRSTALADSETTRQRIIRIISNCFDEDGFRNRALARFFGDRAVLIHQLGDDHKIQFLSWTFPSSRILKTLVGNAISPTLILNYARLIAWMEDLKATVPSSNFPSVSTKFSHSYWRQQQTLVTLFGSIAYRQWLSTYFNTHRQFFDTLARRKMTAVALAIRLYEIDQGRRPGALTELVPNYLLSVPLDPMASDGSTLRYDRERAILYSVGENDEDDNGTGDIWNGDQRVVRQLDIVFYLDGPPDE